MPIKAADYTVGFDTQAAKANWAELEKALQDGSIDVKTAFAELSASFNQVTNVHRTGKKEVDAFTKLIKDEKQETRTLGFLMRNTSESVTALSETFGGPTGLGKTVGSVYSRFDQLNFALEGMAAAGEKAGGNFAKMAGVLGGIAVPAGIALAAFSLVKEEVDKDEEQIKSLQERIRSLNVDLGRIPTTRLAELNRQLAEMAGKGPEMGIWTALKFGIDSQLGTSFGLRDVRRQTLEIEEKTLEIMKAQREERERIRSLQIQIINDSQAEWQTLYAIKNAQMAYEQSNQRVTIESMREQSALLKEQIQTGNEHLLQLIAGGAPLKETLGMELSIMQLLKQRKDLEYQIGNAAADDAVRRSASYQASLQFLREAEKAMKALQVMENRNAPKRIISSVVGVEPTKFEDSIKNMKDEHDSFAIQAGNVLAQNLSSGFMRGFATGKFMLTDFTNAMIQSILQIAAREAAISAVSGLLSLIPGVGSFATIASALGSGIFKGNANSRFGESGSGDSSMNPELTLRKSGESRALATFATDRGAALLQQLVSEARDTRMAMKYNRPALYVGGVTTPDAIVTENIGVAERRRARRMK